MRDYMISLFALCLVCSAVELLSPKGHGDGIRQHIRLLTGLCLLCFLLQPFLALFQSVASLPEKLDQWLSSTSLTDTSEGDTGNSAYEARWQAEQKSWSAAYAAGQIGTMLREKYQLAESNCRVHVALTDAGDGIREVTVALSGKAIWQDTHAMEAFIEETFGCDCTIYIE